MHGKLLIDTMKVVIAIIFGNQLKNNASIEELLAIVEYMRAYTK